MSDGESGVRRPLRQPKRLTEQAERGRQDVRADVAMPVPVRLRAADYGARPDSGEDAVPAVRRALAAVAAAAVGGPVVLEFAPGHYDFYPEQAERMLLHISNTTSEAENPDAIKTFGVLLKGLKKVTVEGNGALWLYHGRMTMLACLECEDVEIRNVSFDYARPTISEMTVEACGSSHMDVRVHPDSRYEIENGALIWIGEGWRHREGPAQIFDPGTGRTWRAPNPVTAAVRTEEREPGRLRLHYGSPSEATAGREDFALSAIRAGQVLQMRDGIRDQVGVFLGRCRNVALKRLGLHYMHGLGVVGQFCENIRCEELMLAPRPETGRTAAAFADFLHFSGCRGRIEVLNSRFAGAHDDAINIHGTYLRIVERPAPNRMRVRFMHGQTYGFDAFFPGDEVEWVNGETLVSRGVGRIERVERLGDRELLLTLSEPAPDGSDAGDVVENVTWTPEVVVRGNRIAGIPTRGLLLTTRRKTVVENNVFEGTAMSAVLIAGDAGDWYESGKVADIRIHGNRFIECGEPVIAILPEIDSVNAERPVHSNIRIEDNEFFLWEGTALQARSVEKLRFCANRLAGPEDGSAAPRPVVRLSVCEDAVVERNSVTDLAADLLVTRTRPDRD